MFVITIGPLGKHFGRVIKLIAIGVALLLVALVAWKLMGNADAQPTLGNLGQELSTFSKGFASELWRSFMSALSQWFRFGF